MIDLFTISNSYPAQGKTDTSRAAARKVHHARKEIWNTVLHTLSQFGPHTGSELSFRLGKDILFLRPRLTELRDMGDIVETGERRKNTKGNSEIVWRTAANSSGSGASAALQPAPHRTSFASGGFAQGGVG